MNTQIIAVANKKGGVAKTTTAFNLGAGLVKRGKRVLLVDFDPQGDLTTYIGCRNSHDGHIATINDVMQDAISGNQRIDINSVILKSDEGIDYIPADASLSAAEIYMVTAFCREQILKGVLAPIKEAGTYDYIIIDCLPSLGILLVNALSASDKVIIPVQAQKLALDGLLDFMNTFSRVKSTLNHELSIEGLLLTMVNNTNMSKAVQTEIPLQYPNVKVFTSSISHSSAAADSTYLQKSLVSIKGSKLGAQYLSLADEIINGQE